MSSRRDWIQKIYSSFFRARKKKQGDANDLDRALVKRFQKKQLPRFSQLRYLSRFFSTRERRIVNGALAVVVLTLLAWGVVALMLISPQYLPMAVNIAKALLAIRNS